MIVAMCCTRNWYIHLATELYALFKYNNIKKLYLFIEDDEIPYLKDPRIQFININNLPEYITKQSPNYNTKYTKLSYLRCYFSKVLDCEKLIYIDSDAIVVDNIEELWDLNVDTIAGVKEPGEWSKHLGIVGIDDCYINSGVLIMNLKNIREKHLDDQMIKLLNTRFYHFPDQDVINVVFKDKMYLSNIYNSTETTGFRDDAKIIHYIRERKGWIKQSPRSEIWYNYHNEMIEGGKMDNYFVRATRNFDDNEHNGEKRKAGVSEWWCSAERYQFLKANNAVELIEIKKVELPKTEVVVTEPVETKSTYKVTAKKTYKSKKKIEKDVD